MTLTCAATGLQVERRFQLQADTVGGYGERLASKEPDFVL